MRRAWGRVGLRGRLALALALVAVLSVALSMLLADTGLTSRLDQSARERMRSAAMHTAELAGGLYQQQGGRWTPATLTELGHLAAIGGYRVAVYDPAGGLLTGSLPSSASAVAHARVVVGGQRVGSVALTPLAGQILSGEDRQLRDRLNTLHLIAAGIALAAGLLAALLLAGPLARPLRALTEAARRIERGYLDARVPPAGAPETATLARAFNRLAETLEREEQSRRAAAADVAHELRTPLAGLVSRIEAAQDGVLPDQEANLEAMHTEALRLASLVDDLGKLSDAERPGLLIDKQQIDLMALVAARAGAQGDFFAAKGITLDEQLQPAGAYGDQQRIEQIVDNLLSNALRYTEPGGTVRVLVDERDGESTIEIADTGIGIPGEELPHIFERFWRSERSRARKTGGAGIGLAIVRELVRAHDGRIDVHSKPGEGSRFTVTLPARQSSA
jgi:two-component system sensor histidine kinase BaeS